MGDFRLVTRWEEVWWRGWDLSKVGGPEAMWERGFKLGRGVLS